MEDAVGGAGDGEGAGGGVDGDGVGLADGRDPGDDTRFGSGEVDAGEFARRNAVMLCLTGHR